MVRWTGEGRARQLSPSMLSREKNRSDPVTWKTDARGTGREVGGPPNEQVVLAALRNFEVGVVHHKNSTNLLTSWKNLKNIMLLKKPDTNDHIPYYSIYMKCKKKKSILTLY